MAVEALPLPPPPGPLLPYPVPPSHALPHSKSVHCQRWTVLGHPNAGADAYWRRPSARSMTILPVAACGPRQASYPRGDLNSDPPQPPSRTPHQLFLMMVHYLHIFGIHYNQYREELHSLFSSSITIAWVHATGVKSNTLAGIPPPPPEINSGKIFTGSCSVYLYD